MDLASLFTACSIIISQPLMEGIVMVESGGHPFSININTKENTQKSHRFTTKEEAVIFSQKLIQKGYSVDLGLGQINSKNLKSLNLSLEDVFDPCINLTALQSIFLRSYNLKADKDLNREQKEIAALSRYNTGHPSRGIDNGYVKKVLTRRLVDQKLASVQIPDLKQIMLSKPKAKPRVSDSFIALPDGYSN